MNNMFKSSIFGLVSLVVVSNTSLAAEVQPKKECHISEKDTASLYFSDSVTIDGDLGALVKGKVDFITSLAKESEFKEFVLQAQDVSVSQSYGRAVQEVGVSMTIEFLASYDAISVLHQKSGANSLSVYRNKIEVCK